MKRLFNGNVMYAALIFISLITVLTAIFSITFAQANPWTQKADMPTARLGLASAVVNDSIYAIGGYAGANQPGLQVNEVYDPVTDTWIARAPMPTGRRWMAASTVNGKIYVFGGYTNVNQPGLPIVEEYDPSTDTWTTKTDMPTARLGPASGVVDGIIYVIGGAAIVGQPLSTVEAYDPVTDTWTTKSDMPTARYMPTASVIDGKIYAIGGTAAEGGISTPAVEEYDPLTNTWTVKADMPTSRNGHAASVIDGIIYAIGGGHVYDFYSAVEAYDPVTNVWTNQAPLPEPRVGPTSQTVNGRIYAIGGAILGFDVGHPGTTTVLEYDPKKDLTTLVNQVSVNKNYAKAGNDSVCITTKINDPAGVTLWAEIESPDQTPVDSMQLFDDGNHNDGNAGDSLYANTWPVSSTEELQYYMDLHVIQVGTDTVIHYMNNMASFTTIGPVVLEHYRITSKDSVPNPGDRIWFKFTLKNNSLITTAPNLEAILTCSDPLVELIADHQDYDDIAAGETVENYVPYKFDISKDCPDSTEIQFNLDIISNHYSFWSDSFSILVLPQTTSIDSREMIIRKFSLNQNYPNPFNPATTIKYSLPAREYVTLIVYDCLGKEVQTLVSTYVDAGGHSVIFDASRFSSGLYFYKLQADDLIETRKMLVIK